MSVTLALFEPVRFANPEGIATRRRCVPARELRPRAGRPRLRRRCRKAPRWRQHLGVARVLSPERDDAAHAGEQSRRADGALCTHDERQHDPVAQLGLHQPRECSVGQPLPKPSFDAVAEAIVAANRTGSGVIRTACPRRTSRRATKSVSAATAEPRALALTSRGSVTQAATTTVSIATTRRSFSHRRPGCRAATSQLPSPVDYAGRIAPLARILTTSTAQRGS